MVKKELDFDELDKVTGGTDTNLNNTYCVDDDQCIGCGSCLSKCSVGCISMNDDGHAEIKRNICLGCGECAEWCPVEAISKAF